MTRDTQFDWMRETVYEPARTLEPMPRPMPRGLVAAVILAGIAVACGALAGIARFW